MSDEEEYEYEYSSDGGSGGFEEEEGGGDDTAIAIENAFYEADDVRLEDPGRAVEMYERVVELEESHSPDEVKHRFKALEHIVNLKFKVGDMEGMVAAYTKMLALLSKVTSNECTDAITSVLDTVSSSSEHATLGQMYEITLQALRDANNERLWFSINVRKAKLHLVAHELGKLARLIKELHKSCMLPDGSDDPSKGTYLMEMYALDIQLCTAQGNRARMKEIYPKVQLLGSAISDPRIMGVVHESFGKMHMTEEKYEDSYNEFFLAFRSYQEGGRQQNARTALKYLVLANMLALSDINPFDTREAKVYKDDPEIMAIDALRNAYTANDITEFERILRDKNSQAVMQDEFIKAHLAALMRRVRSQVLVKMVQPYTSIRLAYLARELHITVPEVESLLVELILDRQLFGSIDQMEGVLVLQASSSAANKAYAATQRWTERLEALRSSIGKSIA